MNLLEVTNLANGPDIDLITKSTQVASVQCSYGINGEERLYLVSSRSELQALTDFFLTLE